MKKKAGILILTNPERDQICVEAQLTVDADNLVSVGFARSSLQYIDGDEGRAARIVAAIAREDFARATRRFQLPALSLQELVEAALGENEALERADEAHPEPASPANEETNGLGGWRASLTKAGYQRIEGDLGFTTFRRFIQRSGKWNGKDLRDLKVWREFVEHYDPPLKG